MIIQQHKAGNLINMDLMEFYRKHRGNIAYLMFVILYVASCNYTYQVGLNNGRVLQCQEMGGMIATINEVGQEPRTDCFSKNTLDFYNGTRLDVKGYELSQINLLNITN